ncbi:MAG: PrsW family glutamic-type intramembrane protease [Solirubrobacteraceae bacterium]
MLVPIGAWMRDRPWTMPSVQWFLFFTIFPLFLVAWTTLTGSDFNNVAYLYAIYFAMIWGLVIWLFVRPERIGILDVLRVGFFTSITGVFIVAVVYRLPFMAPIVAATRGPSLLWRLVAFVSAVGLLEEGVKTIPLLWIFVRNRERGTIREITYLGCVSGFAFGISEAVAYSVFYAQNVARGDMELGAYVVVQLTRLITLPLLHAVFCGIAAQFIALGVENPRLRRGLIVVGIAIAALIHGLYNTFSGTLVGFVLAIGAVLTFIAYVRSVESMRLAIREALEEPAK